MSVLGRGGTEGDAEYAATGYAAAAGTPAQISEALPESIVQTVHLGVPVPEDGIALLAASTQRGSLPTSAADGVDVLHCTQSSIKVATKFFCQMDNTL